MEKYNSKKPLKKRLLTVMVVVSAVLGIFSSCNSDNITGPVAAFPGKMMGQYLQDSTDYSEFVRLLDTTKVMGLLNAYGIYTCFAPSNAAMKKFYVLKGKKSLKDFTLDTLKTIAYDHIINGTAVITSNFIVGNQPELSMSDRYFSISFSNTGIISINTTSQIIESNILVHNGVIHKINQVLNPTQDNVVGAISKDSTFTVFYSALIATGLADSLLRIKDASYDPTLYTNWTDYAPGAGEIGAKLAPPSRKYGYTVLMESNATMKAHSITNLASMINYAKSVYDPMYPGDAGITDITNRHNSLNRFIAYHLINKLLTVMQFIDAYDTGHMLKTLDMYEYIETMCPNALIEIKKDRLLGKTNLINYSTQTGNVIQLVLSNSDKAAKNGVYHEIDGMLVYDVNVDAQMSSKRLRFDAASFFPELTNNNMRGKPQIGLPTSLQNTEFLLPRGYIDRITSSEITNMYYLSPCDKYTDYEGDEIFLQPKAGSLYDFTVTTPPVPKGTYEVRFGFVENGQRDVAQMSFDGVTCGVPLNLTTAGTDPSIGWVLAGSDASDPFGYDNDKMMRNQGYMKGPDTYKHVTTGFTANVSSARLDPGCLRKILGIYTFSTAGTHTLTVTGLSGGQFMFDYVEFVPTSVIESEDVH